MSRGNGLEFLSHDWLLDDRPAGSRFCLICKSLLDGPQDIESDGRFLCRVETSNIKEDPVINLSFGDLRIRPDHLCLERSPHVVTAPAPGDVSLLQTNPSLQKITLMTGD